MDHRYQPLSHAILRNMNSRPGSNSTGAYTNSYYDDRPPTRYDRSDDDGSGQEVREETRAAERRPGGYGGFGFSQPQQYQPQEPQEAHVTRPTSLERKQAKRRSGDRWSGSRSRSGPRANGYGDGSRQIEEVLQYIKRDWDFMTDDKCVPIQVALQLMDSSSLGLARRYDQFLETRHQLHSALKATVNEHHQGFNSSIGTFHKIQNSIQTSQARVRELRGSLVQAKSSLSTTKPELRGFATDSQSCDDMLQVLSTIQQLQSVPEKLEARISEKNFLSAVEILQDALRTVRRSDMENIGALSDLRVYLSNQEHSLTDILIEELHNHLYLKSPYCEDRWKAYAQGHVKATSVQNPAASLDGRAKLYQFLDGLDTSHVMPEDASRNPEADTFHYIQLLVEALNSMSRLDVAVEAIEQRLPVELFRIVEQCSKEVDQHHPSVLRESKGGKGKADFLLENSARAILLNDLLRTLYARFEAIAEGHRVVHDVVSGIAKREGLRDAAFLTGGFRELWKLYQSEMRSLLHDYLATDGNTSYRSGARTAGTGNVFQRARRDKNKGMFKLSDMDNKSGELTSEREDLEFILKSSVPGLVSDSRRLFGLSSANNSPAQDGSATGHKLLVEPSVFNMGVLLPPSLGFLNRLKEVVPSSSDIMASTLTSFLDDFLVNVFLPQLDETLVELCIQTFIEADAFQQDPQWATYSQRPIFKGTAKFFNLVTAFCRMLDNLPHDQAFSQLLITQMMAYYDKCFGWYKAMVTRAQPKFGSGRRLKSAAAFAESGEIHDVLVEMFHLDPAEAQTLLEKEIRLLIANTNAEALEESDLILDRKNIAALCLLFTSMKWLASKVGQLRHISDRATDSSRRESGRHQQKRRWTIVGSEEPSTDDGVVYLPLSPETAAAFDGVIHSYQKLATTVLRTLHLEIRCHVVYHVDRMLKAPYQLEQLLNDPDPEVLALNANLVEFDGEVSSHLQPRQQAFINNGLAALADSLIVTNTSNIATMNANGCGRMQLNILVLQQNLKNLEPAATLSRASLYFDYFSAGPDAIVSKAKETSEKDLGFSYEELKKLVELCYSEKAGSDRREVSVVAKRELDDHLLQLSEHLWQS